MKSLYRWTLLPLLLTSLFATDLAASKRTTQIAVQSRDRITAVARALTAETWAGRIDEVLAGAPDAKNLGAKWNPAEPHWHKAAGEILGLVMKRFDALHDAPQALERLEKPFADDLTEAQAAEVLALSAEQRKAADDYADGLTLAVEILERHPEMKLGSEEYRRSLDRLATTAGVPPPRDVPKVNLSEATLRAYRQARSFSVRFLVTALDGQLQLYFFDHMEELSRIANKAARAAR